MKLTAVILTHNEEGVVADTLESLNFCDELIVVDDFSNDSTARIAKGKGAKVFKRHLSGNFASQRNFGLGKASGEWVLFIDADEKISDGLKEEIVSLINIPANKNAGYFIKRTDFYKDKELKHGECGNVFKLRLAKKDSGIWKRRVHEFWDVKGQKGYLKESLFHYPYKNLYTFVEKLNFYSTLHAKALNEEGKHSSLVKIIIWPTGKFFDNYFIKHGFLDGNVGFLLALFMSLHSFLAWSKLWILQKELGFSKK
jgi:glycosyltransferase involved in cell wall biosynthesis